MAKRDSIDFTGNGFLMKAAEYLRMVPVWKQQPGKLLSGHAEQCEILSRYLVNHFCQLEGKEPTERYELHDLIAPVHQVQPVTETGPALDEYRRQVDAFHLELSMLRDAIGHMLTDLEGPEWQTSTAYILAGRLDAMVEGFPHPPGAG